VYRKTNKTWIPAPDQVRGKLCAGMTNIRVDFQPTNSSALDSKQRAIRFDVGWRKVVFL